MAYFFKNLPRNKIKKNLFLRFFSEKGTKVEDVIGRYLFSTRGNVGKNLTNEKQAVKLVSNLWPFQTKILPYYYLEAHRFELD